jgi:hydrogenase maturation protein HypF
MAEHGLDGRSPVLGICFDGTGYGTDGAIWGGEVLLADYHGFQRLAHLKYVPLPGGDGAIRHPARAALAHLWAAGMPWTDDLPPVAATSDAERRVILRQLETGFNAPLTSSAGRLFDAVAALIGLRATVTYEAQAAMELEGMVQPSPPAPLSQGEGSDRSGAALLPLSRVERGPEGEVWREKGLGDEGLPLQIDPAPLIAAIAEGVRASLPPARLAAQFHAAFAEAVTRLLARLRAETGVNVAALSGGVFQNLHLLGLLVDQLQAEDFVVLTHEKTPPNDGGLALGQAIIAGLGQLED